MTHSQWVSKFFLKKTDRSGECWLWLGKKDKDGYGLQGKGGRRKCHRLSWQIHHGEIPDGLSVLHHCDVRHCVRPDHLHLGTSTDNAVDRKQHGVRFFGEQNPNARLTAEQVREIRESVLKSNELANAYGTSPSHISGIRSRKCWRHIA